MKYFLAINYGCYEGWQLKEFKTLGEILAEIKQGGTHGNEFKVFEEIELQLKKEEP